jgi:PAS domain S-box-containing protein
METLPNIDPGELFRLTVELSPTGMLAVDDRGVILLVNAEVERLFGYSRDELVGRPVETLVPGRLRDAHPRHRAAFLHEPRVRGMGVGRELSGVRKDGTEFPVEIGLNPVRSGGGLLVFASIVDVTQRRQLEEQQRQSQKLEAIGMIAGGIAHDFNNLLLGIVGHTELARDATAPGSRTREDLEQVLRAAERGRELVQRILTFSRRREVTRVPTRLEEPLREALGLLRASLPATIEMREQFDPRTPAVLADSTEVHQILMNLATNSAHAMEQGGVLEVRLEPFDADEEFARRHPEILPGPHAKLTVTDRGRGMSEEVLRRAFEPFFSTRAPGAGTGLGLSVIRGIVRDQGGLITLWSRPGEGTRVEILLPALPSDATLPGPSAAPPAGLQGREVMLVDDEPALASLQRRRLEDLGCRVTVHTSSPEALEDFRRRPDGFDLVITDNTMPRLTGLALAGEIHALRPRLPILMVSGVLELEDPERLRASGIRGVLQKPHRAADLEQAVRRALEPRD